MSASPTRVSAADVTFLDSTTTPPADPRAQPSAGEPPADREPPTVPFELPEQDNDLTSGTAHIVVPVPESERPSRATVLTSDAPTAVVNAVFDGLDGLLATMRGASVEDRLTALIPALIDRGMNTRDRIVGAARRKGFNKERTGKLLTKYTGKLWRRGRDGVYSAI